MGMNKLITDYEIRLAAAEYYDIALKNLLAAESISCECSFAHKKAMKALIRNAEKRHAFKAPDFRRVAAAAAAAIVIAFCTCLSVDVSAREQLITLVRSIYQNHIEYLFIDKNENSKAQQNGEMPVYEIGWLPEGMERINESSDIVSRFEYYENSDKSLGLAFWYQLIDESEKVTFFADELKYEPVEINGMYGEAVIAVKGSETNTVVWINDGSKMLFHIGSNLPLEDILKIAESIKIK